MNDEKITDYIDLVVASTAKQFGSISLDAIRLLTVQQLNKSVLTYEEVKHRTRATGYLVTQWIHEGKLHPIMYPDQSEPLFDRLEVDRLVLQYVVPTNESLLKTIQKMEQKARKKLT